VQTMLSTRCAKAGFILVALLIAPNPACAGVEKSVQLRVRLEHLKSAVSIQGMGLDFPGMNPHAIRPFQSVVISWQTDSSGRGMKTWTVRDRDSGETLAIRHAEKFSIDGDGLRMNLKPMPNRLTLQSPARGSGVDLIAQMDIEDYLRGVLPSEMPSGWPLEALKAQAVAARTYALYRYQIRERAGAAYHLESSVMDQVFLAPDQEDWQPLALLSHRKTKANANSVSNVERALLETKGIVLRDLLKRPFATFFHADCGGHTEEASRIWGGSENLGTAADDGCPLSPMAQWHVSLNVQDLSMKLRPLVVKRQSLVASVAGSLQLVEIEALDRSPSGRINNMSLHWSDQSQSVVSGQDFRMAVGADRIRSTKFSVARDERGGQFEFSGQGYGHGVGLCQWGSRHLALSGHGFLQILSHYYPKALISSVNL
jgi:stage II sporulation protein D